MTKEQIIAHIVEKKIPFMVCKETYELYYIDYTEELESLIDKIYNMLPTHWVGNDREKGE